MWTERKLWKVWGRYWESGANTHEKNNRSTVCPSKRKKESNKSTVSLKYVPQICVKNLLPCERKEKCEWTEEDIESLAKYPWKKWWKYCMFLKKKKKAIKALDVPQICTKNFQWIRPVNEDRMPDEYNTKPGNYCAIFVRLLRDSIPEHCRPWDHHCTANTDRTGILMDL